MNQPHSELDALIEQEKRQVAREVHEDAWQSGLLEGLDAATLADAAISTALQETIRENGEETALALVDSLRDRIAAGEFSPERILQ